jgi:hypothetical protein
MRLVAGYGNTVRTWSACTNFQGILFFSVQEKLERAVRRNAEQCVTRRGSAGDWKVQTKKEYGVCPEKKLRVRFWKRPPSWG